MEPLTAPEREAKTDRQIAMVDEQLTKEFSILPAHRLPVSRNWTERTGTARRSASSNSPRINEISS